MLQCALQSVLQSVLRVTDRHTHTPLQRVIPRGDAAEQQHRPSALYQPEKSPTNHPPRIFLAFFSHLAPTSSQFF